METMNSFIAVNELVRLDPPKNKVAPEDSPLELIEWSFSKFDHQSTVITTAFGMVCIDRYVLAVHRFVENCLYRYWLLLPRNAEADRNHATKVRQVSRRHKVTQQEINWILVANAFLGKSVVRLKGGDPFVFGRGMEEKIACESQGVQCTVVPGISSAIAGPGAMGIPVTSRGVARSFAVVTGQVDSGVANPDIDFEALSKLDTVVFLMGRRNLRYLIDSLVRCGKDPQTAVACVQDATLESQQSVSGDLENIVRRVEQSELVSPMITVVGDVAQFCQNAESPVAEGQYAS